MPVSLVLFQCSTLCWSSRSQSKEGKLRECGFKIKMDAVQVFTGACLVVGEGTGDRAGGYQRRVDRLLEEGAKGCEKSVGSKGVVEERKNVPDPTALGMREGEQTLHADRPCSMQHRKGQGVVGSSGRKV